MTFAQQSFISFLFGEKWINFIEFELDSLP